MFNNNNTNNVQKDVIAESEAVGKSAERNAWVASAGFLVANGGAPLIATFAPPPFDLYGSIATAAVAGTIMTVAAVRTLHKLFRLAALETNTPSAKKCEERPSLTNAENNPTAQPR
jgi:hypothetical protein